MKKRKHTAVNIVNKDINKHKKIKRAFDYEEDIEDLGIETDNVQRNKLSKAEIDSVFVATTNVIKDINKIRNNQELTQQDLERLKKELNNTDRLLDFESFDIFGNIKNDKTKVSVLANKKHRESEKDKYTILDISDNTTLEEYEEKLKKENININKALEKIKATTDINIYMCSNEKINLKNIEKFYISPYDAIKKEDTDKISLYKIKVKSGMSIIYNTNIMYYNNFNNTLPIGMDVEKAVIFDMNKYKMDLRKQKIFRINGTDDNFEFREKLYEFVWDEENMLEVAKMKSLMLL